MSKSLYLVRGIPGSGKTTTAHLISKRPWNVFEADDYFYDEAGKYFYDASKIKDAHKHCQRRCEAAMRAAKLIKNEDSVLVVSSTFIRRWEMEPYIVLAEKYGYSVTEIVCRGHYTNVHGVPEDRVRDMEARFEA